MGIEIERKFLVTGSDWRTPTPQRYSQGYLNTAPDRTVRIRIAGDLAWLTIKGRSAGATRQEFEYEIPVEDARQLLGLCVRTPVEKFRHVVQYDDKIWEVDEFLGDNQGLVVAEIELESEDEIFAQPTWLGEEVTGDSRYFNSHLAEQPFNKWHERDGG